MGVGSTHLAVAKPSASKKKILIPTDKTPPSTLQKIAASAKAAVLDPDFIVPDYEEDKVRFEAVRHKIACPSRACSEDNIVGSVTLHGSVPRKNNKRAIKLTCSTCKSSFHGQSARDIIEKFESWDDVPQPSPDQVQAAAPATKTPVSMSPCTCNNTMLEELRNRMMTMERSLAQVTAENRQLKEEVKVLHQTKVSPPTQATLESIPEEMATEVHATNPTQGAIKPPSRTPPTWAEVAKLRRPVIANPTLRTNINQSKTELLAKGFLAKPTQMQPTPTAVYFGGVQRGPVGQFRRTLLQTKAIPGWACLSVSFIGSNVCEIVCHAPLKDRLIATLKHIGFRYLPSYDPVKARTKSVSATYAAKCCLRRWIKCAVSTNSVAATKFYTARAEALRLSNPDASEAYDKDEEPTVEDQTTKDLPAASTATKDTPTPEDAEMPAAQPDDDIDEMDQEAHDSDDSVESSESDTDDDDAITPQNGQEASA